MRGPYTEQIQRLFCLLFVLEEMPVRPARKQQVLEYIRQRQYLDIRPEDLESYVTQIEPRWNADIVFRRKDGIEWGLLFKRERDALGLDQRWHGTSEENKNGLCGKKFDVRKCYLWTKRLKKGLDPDYEPSPGDTPRPKKFKSASDILDFLSE